MTLAAYTYTYDVGDRLQSYMGPEGTLTYAYAPTDEVTAITASNGIYNEGYSYTNSQNQDLNGNRYSATVGQGTAQTYGARAPANRLTSDGQYAYAYDNAGNVTSKYGSESGHPVTYAYTWDYRNRLTRGQEDGEWERCC